MSDVKPQAVKSTDDLFGILSIVIGGGTAADVLTINGVTRTPIAKSISTVSDEYGDLKAKTVYGAATTMFEATAEYKMKSGTLDLSNMFLGQCATAGTFITAISIKTSNSDWPTISVTGSVGKTLEDAPTGFLNKWALPAITLYGKKLAQNFGGGGAGELGFDVTADDTINGSGLDFSVNLSETTNGEGLPVAFSLSGADGSMSADLAGFADMDNFIQPWTLDTTTGYLWINLANPATVKAQNEYWTGSAQATLADPSTNLPRTASA